MMGELLLTVNQLSYFWEAKPSQSCLSTLSQLDFNLRVGELKAILGPNGSGKSTLLRILAGLISPKPNQWKGQVSFSGRNLSSFSASERSRAVSYLGSDFNSAFPITVEEAVMLGCLFVEGSKVQIKSRVEEVLDLCLCQSLRKSTLGELSCGQRQLVGLARSLAQSPRVLILDESFSKMDLDHRYRMAQVIKNWVNARNSAVLWVSHDLSLVRSCASSVLWLKDGKKFAEGQPCEMLTGKFIQTVYPAFRKTSEENGEPNLVSRCIFGVEDAGDTIIH